MRAKAGWRGLALAGLAGVFGFSTPATSSEDLGWGCASAAYFGETTEYRHGVLGDAIEYKSLYSTWIEDGEIVEGRFTLPDGQVFEDIAPRCADFNGDGVPDPVVIIADARDGARLAIFVKGELFAQNPPIGTGNRWLAPAGIADFTGDGVLDIAYVDRPHIFGMLRLWTVTDGALVQVAELKGFSNHRIGEDFITGGARDCGQGPELVLPDDNWSRLMIVRYEGGELRAAPIADRSDPATVKAALNCKR
ncbi:MAG: VCBS repeat-containing protein [Pseudomonadota bacterium]